MSLSDRLRAMRERLDLTLEQVSGKTGIGTSSLSEFERGKRDPSLAHLQRLAGTYETSLAEFFDERPIASGGLLWRDKPASPVAERVEAKFLKLCRQYRNLEVWTSSSPPDSFRQLMVPIYPSGYPEVGKLAHRIGRELELGEKPGSCLLRVLEEAYGIRVFHLQLESEGSSASWYSEDWGPSVLLNKGNVKWRRNFDMAHELFHLLTWQSSGRPPAPSQAPSDIDEKYANAFAARLLLPDESLRDSIESVRNADGSVNFEALDAIARQFEVSIEALMWRLPYLYATVSSDQVRGWIEKVKDVARLSFRPDEPASDYPARYHALVVQALRQGELSSARAAEFLGESVSAIQKFLDADVPPPAQIPAGPS